MLVNGSRKPVAADVARAVGVSKTTVSYVFSEQKRHKISAETTRRVLAEAERVGFRPNGAARALRTGHGNSVLAVLPDWDMGPAWSFTLQLLSDLLAERGIPFSAVKASPSGGQLWGDLAPAAVVAIADVSPELAALCTSAGVPLVSAGTREMLNKSGYAVSAALHAAGHERIGYLMADHMPREIWEYRFEGIREYCMRAGLPEPVKRSFDYSDEGIANMRASWLEGDGPVSGIIAHNDEVGVFFYIALRDAGFDTTKIGIVGAADRPISKLGLSTVTESATDDAPHRIAKGVLNALAVGTADPSIVTWSAPVIVYRESFPPPPDAPPALSERD